MDPRIMKFFPCVFFLAIVVGITPYISAQNRNIIGERPIYRSDHITKGETHSIKTKKSNTQKLALEITRGKQTNAEKAKAIFQWITTNIEYDNELRLNRKLQKEIYTSEENVVYHALKRKKALCGGYAFLFKQLCEAIGIKAEVIHGFTKQGNTIHKTSQKPEHTWNAVYLNAEWKLLDITWAVSHGSPGKPRWFWYATKPSDFKKTHVPQNGHGDLF